MTTYGNRKAPDKGGGLDWGKIAREREARLAEEAARGVDNEEVRRFKMSQEERDAEDLKKAEKKKPKKKGTPRPKGPRSHTRRFDYDDIVRRYKDEKQTTREIAEEIGCSLRTVVEVLKKAKVWEPHNNGRGGRPLREFCDRGHDQKKHRTRNGKGGSHCGKCAAERNAEYKRGETVKRLKGIELFTRLDGEVSIHSNLIKAQHGESVGWEGDEEKGTWARDGVEIRRLKIDG
jgi:hypothetical protein